MYDLRLFLPRLGRLGILTSLVLLCYAAETQPPATDIREVLAATAAERDELILRVERIEHQRLAFVILSGLLALAVVYLVRAKLLTGRSTAAPPSAGELTDTEGADMFPDSTSDFLTAETATIRRNATITIRNSETQREEVTGKEQTRRLFSDDTRKVTRRVRKNEGTESQPDDALAPSTDTVARVVGAETPGSKKTTKPGTRATTNVASADKGTETRSQGVFPEKSATNLRAPTDRVPRTASSDSAAGTTDVPPRPATVRIDHQSDRLDTVEVTVKPGTTGLFRRQGFTLLEVMISLAILATVMSSVIASIYTLHSSRMAMVEESQAQETGRLLVERIVGGSHLRMSLSGPQPIVVPSGSAPITAAELQSAGIVDQLPMLNNLQVYIEYYPGSVMETAIKTNTPMVFTTANAMDSRKDLTLFRIVIDWKSYNDIPRRHVQHFAHNRR